MMRSNVGNSGNLNMAVAAHTATGSESSFTDVTATFPGNSTAVPKKLRVSGSVSGVVQLQISQNQYMYLECNPNAPFTEADIPAKAFGGPVTGVSIGFEADGAGTIRAVVIGQ
jgi:hypothetical protein